MGRHSIIFNNRKTVKSITLIAILVTMLSSSLLPTNIVASGLTVTVETNKSVYMPGEMLTISGTVRMDGAPVPYAYISMTITGPGVNQTNIFSADTNGFYSTSNPIPQGTPIGDYNVTVATEYKDKLGHVIYSLASKVFTVAAPSAEDVTITVNGPNDTPLADANVILYDHYNGQWINNTLTNATGIAVMKVYPSILFDILVYKTGYGATQEGAVTGFLFDTNDTVGYTSPCQITLALTSVDFGTLNGTIVDATDSTPLDSALVSILAYIKGRTYWVSSVSSAGDGSYSTGLNTGLWRVWTDRRENGNLTHIGTWNDAIITNSTTKTLDMQLWPIAELVIESLEPIEQQYEILLINETYGGVVWRSDISFPLDLPLTMDIPAVNGNVIILTKTRVFSSNIEALPGDTVTLNASLYDKQYEIWSYPNDWEKDRLFGNLTIVSNVVDLETLGQEGPTQFVDPEGTLKEYLLVDRGPGIPTIWRTMGTPTRMDVGCYYQFFDLDALNAPEGYYYTIVLIKNSTGDVVSASPDWFNRFRYQVQPITERVLTT